MTTDSRLRTPSGESAMDETNDAVRVNVVTGTGLGGTQYTEGETDATIAGTAMLMEGAGDALVPVQGTAAAGMLVNLGTNNDVTVTSGTITTVTSITNSVAVTGTFYQATQPVSGTFWQATQPVSGTFWQATQPVSAASLPLPTGAAAETTLDAVKTAVEVIDNAISGSEMQVDVVAALPAGTNLLGRESASLETSTIYNATTALTPKFALANVAASQTDANVVTAVASKKIRVLAATVVAGATATNITFNTKPAGAGSAISCLFANAANGGFTLPFCPVGHFESASGEGLAVTTGAGATTGIQVTYVEV